MKLATGYRRMIRNGSRLNVLNGNNTVLIDPEFRYLNWQKKKKESVGTDILS